MAGYVMTMNPRAAIDQTVATGVYSTYLEKEPDGYWSKQKESTLADFVTMAAGDKIFFFSERRIYGIGSLVNAGDACRFLNYPGANNPVPFDATVAGGPAVLDTGAVTGHNRWLCLFRPDPAFFLEGVDMDEVLESNPQAFRMLRVMSAVSFIKLDDRECRALEDVILRRNEAFLDAGPEHRIPFNALEQEQLVERITPAHRLDGLGILHHAGGPAGVVRHEMAIECRLLDQLRSGDGNAVEVFGPWDHLSHQVAASPFKPIHYMDRIDVFGYRRIPGYDTISRYLVCEVKASESSPDDVDQLMKYVDWVSTEYCGGDYSQVQAVLVARDHAQPVREHAAGFAVRAYTIGSHPARPMVWSGMKLVGYEYVNDDLTFTRYWPAPANP